MLLNQIQSNNLKLTIWQRNTIIDAIKEGREQYLQETGKRKLTTKKSQPFYYYDLVNTCLEEKIIKNPNLNLRMYIKNSGFHPYVVLHDYVRQLFILVLKLPKKQKIFTPSKYRGEFASSNVTRLYEEGINDNVISEMLKNKGSLQLSLSLKDCEKSPFGLIVAYNEDADSFIEGALRPDQEDWLFNNPISYQEVNNVITAINQQHVDSEEANVVLKPSFEIDDTEIEIRLK